MLDSTVTLEALKRRLEIAAVTASCIAAAGVTLVAWPSPARANCYELIGCTNTDYFKTSQLKQLSCQILWEVRNTIYKENGYCFHTQKAIDAFGNAGCKFDNAGDVPLNAAERHNVSAIKKVEAKKGC
jgi:2-methylcitrate dehydratase PrpD